MPQLIKQILEEDSWPTKCNLICNYHMLQQFDHPSSRGNRWTLEDSSKALGLSVGYISESIKLAREIVKNPELTKLSRNKALESINDSTI